MMGAGGGGFSGPIGGRGGSGGGSSGGGVRSAPTVSGVGNTIGSMDTINRPVTVGGTPGSVGTGDKSVPASLPQTRSETTQPVSAGRGVPPGVYGIKDLFFAVDSETPGHVIISSASTVKLEDGTQVVLRVTGPASVVTGR
jgi:hypothetical protein